MVSKSEALTAEHMPSRPFSDVLYSWITTVDHKRLGILCILYAVLFLVIGGIEATVMRIQLVVPHNHFVSPQTFNQMFTMHGTTMIFFVAMPVLFGFGNYLIPLMIGARDMAFPRLNALSFWLTHLAVSPVLQFCRRIWNLRRRRCAGCWVVRLCAPYLEDIFTGPQH